MEPSPDLRQHAPATQRNRQPILEVLKQYVSSTGTVLEIASGTGEHACFLASHLPQCDWLPTDINPMSLDSIEAWRHRSALDNLLPPIFLDVRDVPWSVEAIPLPKPLQDTSFSINDVRAIASINMVHISPWEACQELIAGAGRILQSGGVLYLYGPYKRNGSHTSPSNAAFDQSLRSRNPEWGVRDLEAVVALADAQALELTKVIDMPANNLSVIFTKK